jgi:hypothetical protein
MRLEPRHRSPFALCELAIQRAGINDWALDTPQVMASRRGRADRRRRRVASSTNVTRRATIDLLCGTYDLSRGIRSPFLMGPDMKICLALIAFSSFGLMRSLPAMAMAQTEQGFPSGIWMLQDETASLTTQSPPDRNYVNGLFIRYRIVPESTHRGPARCRCPAVNSCDI